MIQIRLIGLSVHVYPLSPLTTTGSGIEIPERYREDRKQFRVLGVSPKTAEKYPEIQPGQMAFIPWVQDSKTFPDGTMIVKPDQIHAVWDE